MEKKRRQHYVFQAYLKAWTTNNTLWCLHNTTNLFQQSTANVAFENDFYRLKPLNREEISLYIYLTSKYSYEVKKALFDHLLVCLRPFEWKGQVQLLNKMLNEYFNGNIPTEIWSEINNLENSVDISINNIDEDYYCEIEGEGTNWLNQLRNQKSDFYYSPNTHKNGEPYDDEQFHFLYFVSVQYFRTKALSERWILALQPFLNDPQFANLGISKEKINFENLAPIFFWEYQNSMAFNLRKKSANLTLLINKTDIPFITSDQPVINLKADYNNVESIPEELILYYPISPNIAIKINDNDSSRSINLLPQDVIKLNEAIVNSSYHFIFSNSKETLTLIKEQLMNRS